MSDEITVKVNSYGPGRPLGLVYFDPVSGRKKAKSAGTTDWREAERLAGELEKELRSGQYVSPSKITWAEFRTKYEAERLAAAVAAEETGEVTVYKIWAAHDCGRALNPVAVEGQVIGSVWMALGQALQEEMVWKDGLLMNPGMLEYRSPSSAESPDIECFIVESIDPEGPFGAKEAGEGSLAATIPAISNAIFDAVGVRLREAPFTPERVLTALAQART